MEKKISIGEMFAQLKETVSEHGNFLQRKKSLKKYFDELRQGLYSDVSSYQEYESKLAGLKNLKRWFMEYVNYEPVAFSQEHTPEQLKALKDYCTRNLPLLEETIKFCEEKLLKYQDKQKGIKYQCSDSVLLLVYPLCKGIIQNTFEEFLQAVHSGNFESIMINKNGNSRLYHLVYKLSKYMGNVWYRDVCNSLNVDKSVCSKPYDLDSHNKWGRNIAKVVPCTIFE
jgi:hypothetical protein